jgi:hypothetical protein
MTLTWTPVTLGIAIVATLIPLVLIGAGYAMSWSYSGSGYTDKTETNS